VQGGRFRIAYGRSLSRSDEFEVMVQDDGPGFDPHDTGRRGIGLVGGLARQLRGSFAIERDAGARCILRFPCSSNQQS